MSDFIPENPTIGTPSFIIDGCSIVPTTSSSRKRSEVSDILTWVECFNSNITVLTAFRPERSRDLLTYMALIIRIAKQFPGRCWYNYDRAYRLEAAASNSRNWSLKFTKICTTIIRQWPFNPHHHKYRETANLVVTRVPRMCANHGIWEHAPVRANFVDFAIGAIETGATEHTAQSIVKRSGAKEGKVLVWSQDDVRQNAICRDGANDNNIFSYLLLQKAFNVPSVSSVSPIKIDNLTLQLCCHPDRQKVDYVLNGFRYGFRLGFHPEITYNT